MHLANHFRSSIGNTFDAMQHLAIHWSFVRRLWSQCGHYLSELDHLKALNESDSMPEMRQQIEAQSDRWHDEHNRIVYEFMNREIKAVTFREASQIGNRESEHLEDIRFPTRKEQSSRPRPEQSYYHRRRVRRKDIGVDCTVVQAAFSWLDVSSTIAEPDRQQSLIHIAELLDLVLCSLQLDDKADDDEEIDGLPNDFDDWVFRHVARAIVMMRDDENPSSLWRPILTAGAHAHEWTERFFWYWFSDGFHASANHKLFQRRWTEMLEFAVVAAEWNPDDKLRPDLDEMVVELMGFHFGLHTIAADSMFSTAFEEMLPIYEFAVQRWFSMPRVANAFSRNLSEPGYDKILCSGIRWLHQSMTNADDYQFWREHEIESNLISALHRCWERHSEAVCAGRDLQTAFLGLLTALASRGNHAAMALRERLLDSISREET